MSSRTFSAGSFTYNHNTQSSELDRGIYDRLNGVIRDESNPETCSPETLRKFADRFDGEARAKQIAREGANAFLVRHPEFKDTDANGKQLAAIARAVFGSDYPTDEQLEHCYPRAVEQGLLELDQNKLKAQADEKAKASAKEQLELSQEEMETFDLNDIRAVAEKAITPAEARRRNAANIRNGF